MKIAHNTFYGTSHTEGDRRLQYNMGTGRDAGGRAQALFLFRLCWFGFFFLELSITCALSWRM